MVGFAATEYPTVPSPLPLTPLVIVTHVANEAAVQMHPLIVPTATEPVEAAGGTDEPAGVSV